jgi:RND family efflux transporter MFP subunit
MTRLLAAKTRALARDIRCAPDLGLLGFILILLFTAACTSESHDQAAHDRGEHTETTASGETVWTCSMHPQIQESEPGTCPICGMDLVKQSATGGDASGVVTVSDRTQQTMGVRTTRAEVRPLERQVRTTGRFEAPDDARVAVSPKVGGWVERLHVDYEGARVRRGDPLLAIYSPDLVATQEEYLLALRNARQQSGTSGEADAKRLLQAAERRLLYWDISDAQIQRLRESGTPTKTLTLYAPSTGTVTAKSVTEGQEIRAGQTVLELTDLRRLWLMVDVYEQDLAWVREGAEATLTLPYQPGTSLEGRVDYLYDTLDPATRTVRARLTVRNPDRTLRPGMYATALLNGQPTDPSPVVPTDAVIRSGERDVVIQALGNGDFRPVEVHTGLEADGQVQILHGLTGGEQVVTRAQFLIDSEARLSNALGAMSSGHQHGSMDDDEMDQPRPLPSTDSLHVVEINVTGPAFEPDRIDLPPGQKTRLVFTRHTDRTCATEVSIPGLGVEETPLPLHEPVAIEVTPTEAGTYTFACGMDMIEGALLVRSG